MSGGGYADIATIKRTLEIFDRLGYGERIVNKGVTWNIGRVFSTKNRATASTSFRNPAITGLHSSSACSNTRARAADLEIWWKNKLVGISQGGTGKQAMTRAR